MASLNFVWRRIAYLRVLFKPKFWRWVVEKVDYAYQDQVVPWTELEWPERTTIHPSTSMHHAKNIELGNDTRIQNDCVLWASPNSKIRIGDLTGLGPGTKLFSSNHQFVPGLPYHKQPWTEKDITIGRDVWVGANCVIVAGVTIGDGSIVAAGSVVTKDVPPNSIAGGVPARVLRTR